MNVYTASIPIKGSKTGYDDHSDDSCSISPNELATAEIENLLRIDLPELEEGYNALMKAFAPQNRKGSMRSTASVIGLPKLKQLEKYRLGLLEDLTEFRAMIDRHILNGYVGLDTKINQVPKTDSYGNHLNQKVTRSVGDARRQLDSYLDVDTIIMHRINKAKNEH